jgi:uncharacterized protein
MSLTGHLTVDTRKTVDSESSLGSLAHSPDPSICIPKVSPVPFDLVGVLHLPPLPGAANYRGEPVLAIAADAAADARILDAAGFSSVMFQDASDIPQPVTVGPATVAAMSVIGAAIREATSLSLGVIAGHNDGESAVAIAHAVGAQFVRVKVLTGAAAGPAGVIQGCGLRVAHTKRLLGSDVTVWADIHETTSAPLAGSFEWEARQAVAFGGADRLILTRDSGVLDALNDIALLRETLPEPVGMIVGGRANLDTIDAVAESADGAIIGSALKGSADSAMTRVHPAVAAALAARVASHSRLVIRGTARV